MSKNTSVRVVLAVVDGTASSLTGVDQAVAYAGLYDATLAIVVVTENLAWAAAVDPMAYAEAMEASEAQRKEHVAAVRERVAGRSEEHTSELQSLMRMSYAVLCLKKKRHTWTMITTWPLHS